jgi:hypothetical protein
MNSEKSLTPVNDTSAGNVKANAGMGETQPKKQYNAPQLIEHGSVETITGFTLDGCVGSGCAAD